jgi:hypothetical protein
MEKRASSAPKMRPIAAERVPWIRLTDHTPTFLMIMRAPSTAGRRPASIMFA